jgi:hypothetical protein
LAADVHRRAAVDRPPNPTWSALALQGDGGSRQPAVMPVALAPTGIIRRQPAPPGWRDAPKTSANLSESTVDDQGRIRPGKQTTPGVWRVPIQDLKHGFQGSGSGGSSESAGGRAIALIPNTAAAAAPEGDQPAPVDVWLHFHGFGAGYRDLDAGQKDYAKVLAEGELRDIDLYQAEQQLLAQAAATHRLVVGVLPQGGVRSNFGDLGSASGAYLDEVFARLVPAYLPAKATPGRLTVSGHSGGGVAAMAVARDRSAAGRSTDVLLFDAINFGCAEKEEVVGKDGKTSKQCKKGSPCASNEYGTVRDWVTQRMKSDLVGMDQKTEAEQQADLRSHGTRLRGVTTASLSDSDTCGYGHWYGLLKAHIETTVRQYKLPPKVSQQLLLNYQVTEARGLANYKTGMEKHERMLAQGNLAGALAP